MAASLRQLRAYAILLEERNFTRAAAALHLSQPAFSALIGGLEDTLGVRLFDRSKRHVAPTVEGADFEAAARRVLAEFDTAIASVNDRAALRRGRVSLALLPSLAAGWLPDVLARYRAKYPGITVDVADVLSEPCIERVMTMRADFALAAVRAETPELQAEVFCADDFHLVCRADHPLAKAATIKLRDLAAWPFIHLSRTSSVRQYLDAAFHPQAMDTVMVISRDTVRRIYHDDYWQAAACPELPPALALFHFEQPEIATRPVRLPGLARRIYLVRRRDRSLSVAAQALHDLVLAHRPAPAPKAPPRTPQRGLVQEIHRCPSAP